MFKWLSSLFRLDFSDKKNNFFFVIVLLFYFFFFSVIYDTNTVEWNKIYELNFFYKNLLTFNFLYVFNFYIGDINSLSEFFTYIINLFFSNSDKTNFLFEQFIFDLNINEYTRSLSGFIPGLFPFYLDFYNNLLFNIIFVKYNFNEYLYHILIYSSNLPFFFYFGLLFIFTTITSLIFLSYLGFYGVFVLNLFSLLLF